MKYIILIMAVLFAIMPFSAIAAPRQGDPQLREKQKPVRKDTIKIEEARTLVAPNRRLLDAIQKVETGGEKDPANAVGDNGKALGWFQIHKDYYLDAASQMHDNYIHYRTGVHDLKESQIIVCLYWRKHGVKTDKDKALIHHYGATKWRADKNADPDGYFAKVQAAMR